MKKILWILFCILFIFEVEAKIYYSEYGDFSEYQKESIIGNDLIDVKTDKFYRWYRNVITSEYKLYEDNNSFDNSTCYMETSDWLMERLPGHSSRVEEKRIAYKYEVTKKIRYVYLNNDFDIKITNNGQQLTSIYEDGLIDLGNAYAADAIKIEISFDDGYYEYNLGLSENGIDKYIDEKYIIDTKIDGNKRNHVIYDFDISLWSYEIISLDRLTDSYGLLSELEITQYRYHDYNCLYTEVVKEYYPLHSKEAIADYINKDETDYITMYRYRKRNKIEIADDIVITDFDFNWSDYIKSTSDYEIITNLDLNNNGYYEFDIITDFVSLSSGIKVAIKENSVYEDRIKELLEINNQLNNEIDKLIINGYQKNDCEVLKEEISGLSNRLKYEQDTNESLNNKLNDYLLQIKNNDISNNWLYILITVIVLLLLSLIGYLRKKSN